jgi:hypothetical protein
VNMKQAKQARQPHFASLTMLVCWSNVLNLFNMRENPNPSQMLASDSKIQKKTPLHKLFLDGGSKINLLI